MRHQDAEHLHLPITTEIISAVQLIQRPCLTRTFKERHRLGKKKTTARFVKCA